MDNDQIEHLLKLMEHDERSESERFAIVRLILVLTSLPAPPDPDGVFPDYDRLRARFVARLRGEEWDLIEETFFELYCHLHMHEAPYTAEERRRVDETGGYWCHAGGLSPLLKASRWIGPDTVSADFGAGNGLQGLLLQKLYPHARTVQIEISSRMAAIGRRLQEWLGIGEDRVEWIVDDVCNVSSDGLDFIYLYRPVRPEGEGRKFYERFAAGLARSEGPVVIFSIADCLRPFLPVAFEQFYTDGHLTCYRRRAVRG